ncbi:hypothetical protein KHQ08_15605 [Pseudochrobactrum algeriensis]|uniref:hypothetical protein n=1 Tax=Pseudochrobactrum algeriensis TaxID=2834768 RepID=UPI001BCB5706|nr:hypothetical protein [Pseudochrobactrum algeriensis]QVQ36529.1 hypothetical protein KHQ08_15605 [Pseudochrobactrum algeriensis]QVQ39749.1 hypothetical protein KHQ07_13885 [Pseudochrobactrum algeriensis]QVQ43669.1 hypothetical protein KHQ09_15845 [Pseudochrobactrum algeriensis]
MGLRKNTDQQSSDQAELREKKKLILSVPSRERAGLKDQATHSPKGKASLPKQLLDLRVQYLAGQLSREDYQSAKRKMMQSPANTKPSKNRYAMIAALLVAATIIGIAVFW